jgi:hypothetical protein
MKKVIEYNGKKLEIIAIERHDMPEPYYDFWVKEILEKRHWWNCTRWEILHGNTFWWEKTDNFEEKIMQLIKKYYDKKHNEQTFQHSVENFFND